MNEQLRRAFEATQQLSGMDQCAVAACILRRIREIEGIKGQEPEAIVEQAHPLTEREFVEKLYREGKVLNIPTWEPLTEEEAERAQLAQACAGGKPLSEIVIEGRGPY